MRLELNTIRKKLLVYRVFLFVGLSAQRLLAVVCWFGTRISFTCVRLLSARVSLNCVFLNEVGSGIV